MGSRWASPAALALVLAALPGAPSGAAAQQVRELGVTGIATASDPGLVVGGMFAGLRTSRRTRVSAAAGIGASDGEVAWRGELLAHFLLSPARRRGAGLYGAGGVAVVGGPVEQAYLVLTLGLEGRPGAPSGWFVEAGVGGGARLAAGFRWRRFPAWWALEAP
jgi:hypothetical protein